MVKLGIMSLASQVNPLIYGVYCLIYSLQYSFPRSITNPPTHLYIKHCYDFSRQRTINVSFTKMVISSSYYLFQTCTPHIRGAEWDIRERNALNVHQSSMNMK